MDVVNQTATLESHEGRVFKYGMRENANNGLNSEKAPTWLIENEDCDIENNPIQRTTSGKYKLYVNKQLNDGTLNGRGDWFSIPTENFDSENHEITIACLNPYKNRCVHKVNLCEIPLSTGTITNGYYYGNWRIEFTNQETFVVDGNGVIATINDQEYILYNWGGNYVIRNTNDTTITEGPTTGTISVVYNKTKIGVDFDSEFITNGNFYELNGEFGNEVPTSWDLLNQENNLNQVSLRTNILKKKHSTESFWIQQRLENNLIGNARYIINISGENGNSITIRFRNSNNELNSNIKFISHDESDDNLISSTSLIFKSELIFETPNDNSDIKYIEIFIDEQTELTSLSMTGLLLPSKNSSVILPRIGGGELHTVIGVKGKYFEIDGVYENLENKYIAYEECGNHIISKYKYAPSWNSIDENTYFISNNMNTLTSFPDEPNSPNYFLDYVTMNYPQFDSFI